MLHLANAAEYTLGPLKTPGQSEKPEEILKGGLKQLCHRNGRLGRISDRGSGGR